MSNKKTKKNKAVSICICVPVDDGARFEFWLSLTNLIIAVPTLFNRSVTFELITNPGDSLITRSRNNLTHDFLTQTKCDYLLFLDTDLDFKPEDIKRLVDSRNEDAIVCGQYAIKQPELRFCYNVIAGEKIGKDGLLKVAEAGTGCMLIPRKILLKMKEKFPVLHYKDDQFKDQRFSFFDVGVVQDKIKDKIKARYLSEDWLFSRRVRQLGFSIYVDTEVLMGHHGWIRYPLPDDFLIAAIASRCVNNDILKKFIKGIDRKAKEKCKQISKTGLIKPSKKSKV